jgi:hypothetical protein
MFLIILIIGPDLLCIPRVPYGALHPQIHAHWWTSGYTSACVEPGSNSTAYLGSCSSTLKPGQAQFGSASWIRNPDNLKWGSHRYRPCILPVLYGAHYIPGHGLEGTRGCTSSCVPLGSGSIAGPGNRNRYPSEPGSSLSRHSRCNHQLRADRMSPEPRKGMPPSVRWTT